jgi:Methylamine utilisation protein MauE
MEERKPITKYTPRDFLPLIVIFSFIVSITLIHQSYYGWSFEGAMRILMASFFLIFGFFKIINLRGFAEAYSIYDLIARRYFWYGYVYPFLEIGLGLAYFFTWNLFAMNIFALVLMLISAAGVFNELQKGKQITCACLGTVFKIPMTYVTLAEDLIMAVMAFIMLIID